MFGNMIYVNVFDYACLLIYSKISRKMIVYSIS